MTAVKKPRAKAVAIAVPQSIEAASDLLAAYGEHANAIAIIDADLKSETAKLKVAAEADAKPHIDGLKTIFQQLQAFGDARRSELLKGGAKSAELTAGIIGWRIDPPSVKLQSKVKVDDVVDWLKTASRRVFRRFLRIKFELNKQAMLDDPELAAEVPGVTIVRDVEQFYVLPAGLALSTEDAP